MGEVEVFHGDSVDVVMVGLVDEPGNRVPDLGIPTGRRPRQVDVDAQQSAEPAIIAGIT